MLTLFVDIFFVFVFLVFVLVFVLVLVLVVVVLVVVVVVVVVAVVAVVVVVPHIFVFGFCLRFFALPRCRLRLRRHIQLCNTQNFHTQLCHTRGFGVAGVALDDIDLPLTRHDVARAVFGGIHMVFAVQAWHLWHWVGSWQAWCLGAFTWFLHGKVKVMPMTLGWVWWQVWSPLVALDALAFTVARVALGDIDLALAWQVLGGIHVALAWQHDNYGAGLALVTRLVAVDSFGRRMFLRGKRGTR